MHCSLIVSDFTSDFDIDDKDRSFSNNQSSNQYCNCSDQKYWYVDVCDCDYPIDEPLTTILDHVVMIGFFYAVVLVFGLMGNGAIIYAVVRFQCLRTVTNVFLASLSISDLFLLLFCIPIQYLKYITHTWIMGSFLCSFVHYFQMFSMTCSVLTLTAISVERYLAIARPMKAYGWNSTGRARRTICLIWASSLILASPAWFTYQTETFMTKKHRTATWCSRWYPEPIYLIEKIYVLYQSIVLFVVPLATMAFCYSKICFILYSTELDFDRSPNHRGAKNLLENLLHKKRRQHRKRGVDKNSQQLESAMVDFGMAAEEGEDCFISEKMRGNNIACVDEIRRKSDAQGMATLSMVKSYRNRRSFGGNSEQNSKQVIRMLLTIVTLFIISWSPYLIDDFLVAFGLICGQSNTPLLKHVRMATALMVYSNACQNPVVYAFMSSQFEQVFGEYYRRICCR